MSVVRSRRRTISSSGPSAIVPIREGERRASAHSRRASYHSRMVVRSARLAGADEGRYGRVVRGSSSADSCGFVGIKDDMVAWVVLGGLVWTKDDRGWCGGCRPWSVVSVRSWVVR